MLFAQDAHPVFWQIDDQNGLPSNTVYDMLYDSKGYMWMGTSQGICKYNGLNFQYFKNEKQKNQDLSALHLDSKGRIWTRNFRNQVFYIENDSLHQFDIPPRILKNQIVEIYIDSEDILWILRDRTNKVYNYNINKYNWDSITITDIDLLIPNSDCRYNNFFDIIEAPDKTILFIKGCGAYSYNKRQNEIKFITPDYYLQQEDLAYQFGSLINIENESFNLKRKTSSIIINKIIADSIRLTIDYDFGRRINGIKILKDQKNNLYLLTLGNGLFKIGEKNSFLPKEQIPKPWFPSRQITDFIEDDEGNYWVSTLNEGVYILPNIKLQTNHLPNSLDIPTSKKATHLKVYRDSLLLLGYEDGRIISFNSFDKNIMLEVPPAFERINCLEIIGGNIIMSNSKFSAIYRDKQRLQQIAASSGDKRYTIYDEKYMCLSLGSVGLTIRKYRDKQKYQPFSISDSLSFSYLERRTFEVKEKRFDLEAGTSDYFAAYIDERIHDVVADDSNERIFVAGHSNLYSFPEWGKDKIPILFKGKSIQPHYLEMSSTGILWAYKNDLIYGINSALEVQYHYSLSLGTLTQEIKKLVIDGSDLWCTTTSGILQINTLTNSIRSFTQSNGLTSKDITDIAIIKDKLWYIDRDGLHSFDTNMKDDSKTPASVYISSVLVNEEKVSQQEKHTLDYKENSLQINFEAISYRSRGNYQFKYRMLGLDNTWYQQKSVNNFVRYPKLNPGSYSFEVEILNNDGVETISPATLEITIRPPFWKTWWFYLLCALAFIGLVVGIAVLRVKNLQKKNKEALEKEMLSKDLVSSQLTALRAQMNPHFIFNAINSIQNLILRQETMLSYDYLVLFAQLVRNTLEYSEKEFISFEKEIAFLKVYMDLEKLRFKDDFTFEIKHKEIKEIMVPSLAVQPFVENAIKHGLLHKEGHKHLEIQFELKKNIFICTITDNGIGRKKSAEIKKRQGDSHQSFSTAAIEKRMEILSKQHNFQAGFEYVDLEDQNTAPKGTKVIIKMPYKNIG